MIEEIEKSGKRDAEKIQDLFSKLNQHESLAEYENFWADFRNFLPYFERKVAL
jgi:hypothetical protein